MSNPSSTEIIKITKRKWNPVFQQQAVEQFFPKVIAQSIAEFLPSRDEQGLRNDLDDIHQIGIEINRLKNIPNKTGRQHTRLRRTKNKLKSSIRILNKLNKRTIKVRKDTKKIGAVKSETSKQKVIRRKKEDVKRAKRLRGG